MNIISQKREFALQNNTAQMYLERALTTLKPTSKLLIIVKDNAPTSKISTGMDGILDFSVLEERGFNSVETIQIQENGGVTELIHLPPTLRILDVANQLLTGIDNLPSSLEELNLRGNYIERLDLANLPKLKRLVASKNRLFELVNLPISLEYIDLNDNPVRSLDVSRLDKLKTLLCTCPDLKRVVNLTPNVKKLETNAAVTHVDYSNVEMRPKEAEERTTEIEFADAIQEYFRLKKKYEQDAYMDRVKAYQRGTSMRQKQKLAKAVIPKCVKCARRVGSIFQHKDNRYVALCGDKAKPCDLKIKIVAEHHHDNEYMLALFQEEIHSHKEKIIKQKLDTIFGFLSEDQSAVLFKKIVDVYTKDSSVYKELLDEHNEKYESPHREALLREKNAKLYDLQKTVKELLKAYVETGDRKLLQTAVRTYVG